ncbi:hypothetical protein [Furfurilactobacillus rossiae]|uniref:Uncharacterized protein n=1 Tax=Furfurilactobacillus rossiae DSM 15814 TaxID=1114972 RepID=A0A0R1RL66_9LACO|nr:hypothetical protein [Furfurilactobacillus rossiae]KRL57484.1 hypothetical protein FD35_GL000505 [Furfurilactobacillus rossiae DSM 15814]QFR65655.1 hypothetical protein LR814_00390 [Furfurilactobacillus rossiae]
MRLRRPETPFQGTGLSLLKPGVFNLDYEPKYTSHKSSRNTKRPNSRRQVLPTWNSVSGQLHFYHNLADYLQKIVKY